MSMVELGVVASEKQESGADDGVCEKVCIESLGYLGMCLKYSITFNSENPGLFILFTGCKWTLPLRSI